MSSPQGPYGQPQNPPHDPLQGRPPQGPPPQGLPPQGLPPQGPPPGWQQPGPNGPGAPNQMYGPPPGARSGSGRNSSLIWTLGLISIAATVAGLTISENGSNAWHSVHAWGAVAIVGAVLTLMPVLNLVHSPQRAWQVSACGAGALILYWVLFVLPSVGSNTSLLTTVGVAAGVIATWLTPARDAFSANSTTPPANGPGRPHGW